MESSARLTSTDSLGAEIEKFKTPIGNIAAAGILSVSVIGAALYGLGVMSKTVYLAGGKLPLHADKGWAWSAVGLCSLLAIGAIVFGIVVIRNNYHLLSHGVELYEGGFCYQQVGSRKAIAWEQVALIRETILYQRPPLLKGPAKLLLPKLKYYSYTVVTKNKEEFEFDRHSMNDVKRVGQILKDQSSKAQVPWETVEVNG